MLLKSLTKTGILSEASTHNLVNIVGFGQDFSILLEKSYRSMEMTMVLLSVYLTAKGNETFMMFTVSFF